VAQAGDHDAGQLQVGLVTLLPQEAEAGAMSMPVELPFDVVLSYAVDQIIDRPVVADVLSMMQNLYLPNGIPGSNVPPCWVSQWLGLLPLLRGAVPQPLVGHGSVVSW
jgi:hypothetical protein